MSFTHQVTEKVLVGGESITKTNTLTSGSKVSIDESLSIGTDTLVALTLDVSQVKSAYIVADTAMTLETNSSGSPANTLTLVAGLPYVWYTNKYDSFKLTTDVTALYVTNAAAGRLQMEFLVDPTV
jgi:hypothetical protein